MSISCSLSPFFVCVSGTQRERGFWWDMGLILKAKNYILNKNAFTLFCRAPYKFLRRVGGEKVSLMVREGRGDNLDS